jgi:hypothetical protein
LYKLISPEIVLPHQRKRNGALNGKKVDVQWTEESQTAFYALRDALCSELVLALPNYEEPFILTTDASECGYGAVLEQMQGNENRIIAYYSKNYTKSQKNYATPEQELLAIVQAVEHFHTYLFGRKFKLFTDHEPLTWLTNKKKPHARMERWMIRLEYNELEVAHKPGKDNIVADMLSRIPSIDETLT